MPIPIFIWIAAAAISPLFAGTAIALNWSKILVALKGKRLAVLGARGVGKTHFLKFLTTGSIPKTYKQTLVPEKTPGRRFKLKDLKLNVKETFDVSGSDNSYNEWKNLFEQANLVFYLLRADRLIAGDACVETRVRKDIHHIGRWLEKSQQKPQLFIVGTHCDLVDEFARLTDDNKGDFEDKFQRLSIISEIRAHCGGNGQAKVVLGSMRTVKGTEAIVYEIFRQVAS